MLIPFEHVLVCPPPPPPPLTHSFKTTIKLKYDKQEEEKGLDADKLVEFFRRARVKS